MRNLRASQVRQAMVRGRNGLLRTLIAHGTPSLIHNTQLRYSLVEYGRKKSRSPTLPLQPRASPMLVVWSLLDVRLSRRSWKGFQSVRHRKSIAENT